MGGGLEEMSEGQKTTSVRADPRPKWVPTVAIALSALILLSVTLAYLLYFAPLKVSLDPAESATAEAGEEVNLTAHVNKGIRDPDQADGVTYRWYAEPPELGVFILRGNPKVSFTAGDEACNGTIYCEVRYKGESATRHLDLYVKPPHLEDVVVMPTSIDLYTGTQRSLFVEAYDSVGRLMPNASFTWSVSGGASLRLNTTSGASVSASCDVVPGEATVRVTATAGGYSTDAFRTVHVSAMPARSVAYRWYDMFNVSFGDWWEARNATYGVPHAMTSSYPYVFLAHEWPGNSTAYSNMRLNITARTLRNLNMCDNPVFLPLFGPRLGGEAVIDWYMQYLTSTEVRERADVNSWNDGWVVSLNGTVTLDEEAALSVIKGLTSASFGNFNTWWKTNGTDVSNNITGWLAAEANGPRLNIYPAIDGNFHMLTGTIDGAKVGDKIVLTYDTVTWGMEAVMMRWLHEAFVPTEWYFEDMEFHARITPYWTDIDIDTVVVGSVHATESDLDSSPCWSWMGMLQDHIPSDQPWYPHSDFDPYAEYNSRPMPLPDGWNSTYKYSYTPGSFNLSSGESLVIEWPSGTQKFLVPEGHGMYNLSNFSEGAMTVTNSEPKPSDFPGQCLVDMAARTITLVGPIDFWTWSKSQTAHTFLLERWAEVGLLPYGMPYIEFSMVT